jgi:hypothetical protein
VRAALPASLFVPNQRDGAAAQEQNGDLQFDYIS